MPLLMRSAARWPTCLYAFRSGTLSRLISASTTTCSQERPLSTHQGVIRSSTFHTTPRLPQAKKKGMSARLFMGLLQAHS